MKQDNPLLHFDALPRYDEIAPAHADEAVEGALAAAKRAVDAVAAEASAPSWDGVMAPLEDAMEAVGRVWGQVDHMHSVMNTPEWRAAHERNLAKVAAFFAEMGQHEGLYARVRALCESDGFAALSSARQKVSSDARRDFELSGVGLPADKKAAFRANSERLAALGGKFESNLIEATKAFFILAEEDELGDMPADLRAIAKQLAQRRGEEGYCFSLQPPSYAAFMEFAGNRAKREKMYAAYMTRASDLGPAERDNSPVVAEMLQTRRAQAALLGFDSHAEVALQTRMAESPAAVREFLQDLLARAKPYADAEMAELRQFAAENLGIADLQTWDAAYAAQKYKRAKFAFSDADLRPYLRQDAILQGLFGCLQKLFGVRLAPAAAPVWHDDVRFMELQDAAGGKIGGVYLDLYARDDKRGGAWMSDALSRFMRRGGGVQLPVAHVTCNFSKPVGEGVALLDWIEVITLFHEFGHAMHHLLSEVDEYSASGISGVEWDAVELPSQLLENFVWDWTALQGMTAHAETGAAMPRELYDKAVEARRFHSGLRLVRQLEFALFDMTLHDADGAALSAREAHALVRKQTAVLPLPECNRFFCGFSHIFAGGYAAGYYSYLWAEVLAADVFVLFEESAADAARLGELGLRFRREVLAVGGSRPAMQSFAAVRGRAPDIAPLLAQYGLAKAA